MIWDVLGQKGYKGIKRVRFKAPRERSSCTTSPLGNSGEPSGLLDPTPGRGDQLDSLVVVGNKLDPADSRRQAQRH